MMAQEPRRLRHPNPRAMVTNPWINRITVLVVMFAIYAAGYAGGRDAAVQAYNNHPACNTNLKP
jgi:heme A synthase